MLGGEEGNPIDCEETAAPEPAQYASLDEESDTESESEHASGAPESQASQSGGHLSGWSSEGAHSVGGQSESDHAMAAPESQASQSGGMRRSGWPSEGSEHPYLSGPEAREGEGSGAKVLEKAALVKRIKECWHSESWKLDALELNDDDAKLIAKEAGKALHLKELSLNRNCIGRAGAQALGKMACKHKSLTKIRLNGNHIDDKGALSLVKWAVKAEVEPELIDLLDNHITERGIKKLEAVFESRAQTSGLMQEASEQVVESATEQRRVFASTADPVFLYDKNLLKSILEFCEGVDIARAQMACTALREAGDETAKDLCLRRGIREKSLWATIRRAGWSRQLHRAEAGLIAIRRENESVTLSDLSLKKPSGPCFCCDGDLLVCDYGNQRLLRMWVQDGEVRFQRISVPGGHPAAVASSPDGGTLAVSVQEKDVDSDETGDHFVLLANTPVRVETNWSGLDVRQRIGKEGTGPAEFQYPNGLTFLRAAEPWGLDGACVLAVSDFNNNRVQLIEMEGGLAGGGEVALKRELKHKGFFCPTDGLFAGRMGLSCHELSGGDSVLTHISACAVAQLADGRVVAVPYMKIWKGSQTMAFEVEAVSIFTPRSSGSERAGHGRLFLGKGAKPVACAVDASGMRMAIGDRNRRLILVFDMNLHDVRARSEQARLQLCYKKEEDVADVTWPWLGLAVCQLTGDILVADADSDSIIIL